jgi:hypothetical protein
MSGCVDLPAVLRLCLGLTCLDLVLPWLSCPVLDAGFLACLIGL